MRVDPGELNAVRELLQLATAMLLAAVGVIFRSVLQRLETTETRMTQLERDHNETARRVAGIAGALDAS